MSQGQGDGSGGNGAGGGTNQSGGGAGTGTNTGQQQQGGGAGQGASGTGNNAGSNGTGQQGSGTNNGQNSGNGTGTGAGTNQGEGGQQNNQNQQQETFAFDNFDDWFKTLPAKAQGLITQSTAGLKSALESERSTRKDFERQVRDISKNLEEGNAAKGKLDEISNSLSEATQRADFFEEAPDHNVSDMRLAYLAAKNEGFISDKGKVDWRGLKDAHPTLFQVRQANNGGGGNGQQNYNNGGQQQQQQTRGNAGAGVGTEQGQPGTMNDWIRNSLGWGVRRG